MNIIKSIFLGIIQGITEFLPVSSSGHLVLAEKFLNTSASPMFDLLLHLGSLLSVIIVYSKTIKKLFQKPFELMKNLIFATIPAVIILYFFEDFVKRLFSTSFLPYAFMFTAIVLVFVDKYAENAKLKHVEITRKSAILMGFAQALAVVPGVSRSGMTISMGLLTDTKREKVTEFSFLMSIPIILGSIIVGTVSEGLVMDFTPIEAILGVLASFLSSFVAIGIVQKAIKHLKLSYFAIYLLLLSIVIFITL